MRTRLILLPGMDGTGILFEPLLRALPAEIQADVVAYPPAEPFGYDELLSVVESALPAEPFVLLAESFSGPLALMAAQRKPAGLRAVVLCASFVVSPVRWFPSALAPLVRAPAFALVPSFFRVRALLGEHATPDLVALLDRSHALVTPGAMAARARAILEVDVRAALKDCPVPLLYLRAEHDRVVSSRSGNLITREKPDALIVSLPGPHLLLQTFPAEALTAVQRLLSTGP